MLLGIDIGNTNTVFALITKEEGAIVQSWRMKTLNDRTADEYAAFFFGLARDHKLDKSIRGIIVSSVVPEANFYIRSFCEKYLSLEALFVTNKNAGVNILIDRPDEVGADRLVNAVAIRENYKKAAIVIDFGTATTFDVVDENGSYKGGVIAPGINLSITALAQAASKLPKVSIREPENAIGRNTVEAMQSGVYYGYVGLIKEILDRLLKEMNGLEPLIIATGGLANTFQKDIDIIDTIDNDLTLKGLYSIYNENK